jgi:hypothetical protein
MNIIENGEVRYGRAFEVGLALGSDTGVETGNARAWVSFDWSFGSLDFVNGILDAAVRQVEDCPIESSLRPWKCVP